MPRLPQMRADDFEIGKSQSHLIKIDRASGFGGEQGAGVTNLQRHRDIQLTTLGVDRPVGAVGGRQAANPVAVGVGFEPQGNQPEVVDHALDLADHFHRLAARVHRPASHEFFGILPRPGRHHVVRHLHAFVNESRQHGHPHPGLVHLGQHRFDLHPLDQFFDRTVSLENVAERIRPLLRRLRRDARGPGVYCQYLLFGHLRSFHPAVARRASSRRARFSGLPIPVNGNSGRNSISLGTL